jgi:hypothetical protein
VNDRDRVLLLGLADGTLRGASARERALAVPDAARLLERQRRVRRVLRDGPVPPPPQRAPAPLIDLAPRRSAPPARIAGPRRAPTLSRRRGPFAPRGSLRRPPRAGLAGALAALLLALLVAPGERSVVDQAAALAHERPTQRSAEGFPDWSGEFGWHQRGARHDTLDGGVSTTVYYEHMGHRLAYTILPGIVERPEGARVVRRDGVEIALYRDGEHDVAVFERDGRTCVLAGHVLRTSTLVKLAAWRA